MSLVGTSEGRMTEKPEPLLKKIDNEYARPYHEVLKDFNASTYAQHFEIMGIGDVNRGMYWLGALSSDIVLHGPYGSDCDMPGQHIRILLKPK